MRPECHVTVSALPMQAAFAQALLDPHATVPGLRAWNGSDPTVRLDVHRNTVVASLVDALADTFPVVQALVGPVCFRALASAHVRAEPPCSPVLAHYGAGFADWLAHQPLLAALPWLSDVAQLEYARVQAFHAAEAPVCTAARLGAALAQPERLPGLVLPLQPGVQVLRSCWAVVSLWAAHQGQGRIEDVRIDQPEAALVLREDEDVVVLPVPLPTGRFAQALRQRRPLGEAVAEGGTGLDLGASLALLLRHGACAEPVVEGIPA